MTNPILIGLHGKPRAGKDTVAAHLIKRLNLLRYGSSVPVKDTTAAMFDIRRDYLDDDKMKDAYDPFWKMTYREMAQKVGKESSRDIFGEDFWLRHVEKKLAAITDQLDPTKFIVTLDPQVVTCKGMILADIRYANECHWVKEHGGTVIFIVRDNLPVSSGAGHAAEKGLSLDIADVVVYNNGTFEELYEQIDLQVCGLFNK